MKRLKKLLSVVLAGAMALSLCATALATDPDPVSTLSGDPAAHPPASTVSGDTETSVSGDKIGSGEINATSVSQGKVPKKPISVILPVIPTRTAEQAQLFDFILDPHQLIKETAGARYMSVLSGLGDADKLFDPDSRLYFSSQSGDEFLYSGSSKVLTVTNTGAVPVDVDLDLEFTRTNADFDLIGNRASLKSGDGVRPEMYLAVVYSGKDGPETKAVLDPANNDLPTVKYTSTSEYLKATTDVTKPVFAFDTTNYKPEDTTATAYTESKALDEKLEEVGIKLTFFPHNNGSDDKNGTADDGVAYLQVEVTNLPNTLTYDVTKKDNTALTVASGGAITDPVTHAASETNDATEIKVKIGSKDDNDDLGTVLATVTFAVTVPNDPAEPSGTQTLSFRKPHTGATIETALGVLDDSYKLAHTTDSAEITDLTSQGVQVTTAGYYWEKQKLDDTQYPAFSFHLEGDINEANRDSDTKISPWDSIGTYSASANSKVEFEMTWDVTPYSKFAKRDQLMNPADGAGGGAQDKQPTVVVDTPATGTGTTKAATLTWTEGTGAYEEYEPVSASNNKGSFTTTGTSAQFKVSGNTITLVANSTLKGDTNCVITFSDGTDTYDVNVTGWYAGT